MKVRVYPASDHYIIKSAYIEHRVDGVMAMGEYDRDLKYLMVSDSGVKHKRVLLLNPAAVVAVLMVDEWEPIEEDE